MTVQDNATQPSTIAVRSGTVLAALGVVSFSFSFPATVWALDGFGPWTATGVRGLLAGLLAGACLFGARVPVPERRHWPGLLTVAAGCGVGFPLLTTLALQTSSTAHSAVVIGMLPLATAAISSALTGRRPSRGFWTAAGTGSLTVVAFTLQQNHGLPTLGDVYLFGALLMCAAGYAQGGRLASHMPGWQVIAWGVVAALPVSVLVAALALPAEPVQLTTKAVTGMAYVAAVSQFGAFVVWYRGMAIIGVPKASQLQLAQPLLTLVWSVLLMGEELSPLAPVAALAVLGCIVAAQRARS
ncbi:drug/metabolite transporter (DMT)-like permease [Haloactinospora alba]|uniref:Drug/metabolite transporter (DMT)-like permease n=1 Tax=Haloactinospora alba TaxID=405555 RepID=A0A543NIJ7_9ACTN|nr:DMT family transporter [Haloactinospora alba]TQN31662.1 drug/metabolite transporter (DMT)-like permease [Haloactinospora alba]